MNKIKKLNRKKSQRIGRVRARISGTAARPRLVVNRTNRAMYAQLIDDEKGITLLSASNPGSKKSSAKGSAGAKEKMTKSASSFAIGEELAKKAILKGIKSAVFDRRSYQFHGRVKSFVDGAKKGGLKI